MQNKKLDRITYNVLDCQEIRDYVVRTCEEEWDPGDFTMYGDDLYQSQWSLKEVEVDKISVNAEMLASESFQKDVQPRIEKQKELYKAHTPIPPLILRGGDLFIFDGYARYLFFKDLGIKKCLAYVSGR